MASAARRPMSVHGYSRIVDCTVIVTTTDITMITSLVEGPPGPEDILVTVLEPSAALDNRGGL